MGIKLLELGARRRVHQHELHLVASQIGGSIDVFVVGRKFKKVHLVLKIRGEHGTKRLLLAVAVENLCVHPVDDGRHGAEPALVVGHPALIVTGIFGQQRQFARVQVEPVRVEHLGVSLVHGNHHVAGHLLQVVDNARAHPGKIGVGAQVAPVQVDAEQAIVLIAAAVLHKKQAAVVGPHVSRHAALRLARQAKGLGRAHTLHKEVHAVFIGGHIRDVRPVGRNLIGRPLGISEEIFQRNEATRAPAHSVGRMCVCCNHKR